MAGAVDFKKLQRGLYQPGLVPEIACVPEMVFIMVDGSGDPNTSAEYAAAVNVLYGLSYGIKMSKKGGAQPEGYFDFVVPPLEGLWSVDDESFVGGGAQIADKSKFRWTSMIRQPEFVTDAVFEGAKEILSRKRPDLDLSAARLEKYEEGLCVHVMHTGPYDDEPETVAKMDRYARESGCEVDISESRRHHEIYLSDPRKTAPEKLKTIIRHPVRRVSE